MNKAEIDKLTKLLDSSEPVDAETLWLQNIAASKALKALKVENERLRGVLLKIAHILFEADT